jgi:hypothetical protein
LKTYKSQGSDQIPAELIQEESEITLCVINQLINSVWNKEGLPDQWKWDITAINFIQKLIVYSLLRLRPYIDEIIEDHPCGFCITDQLLITFYAFVRYWEKLGV